MDNKIIAHTGGYTPVSGQYRPSGGTNEITLSKGERVPPNNVGVRQSFTLVDTTKHKAR